MGAPHQSGHDDDLTCDALFLGGMGLLGLLMAVCARLRAPVVVGKSWVGVSDCGEHTGGASGRLRLNLARGVRYTAKHDTFWPPARHTTQPHPGQGSSHITRSSRSRNGAAVTRVLASEGTT
eukprot:4403615-Prymnesium_polylepis.1